MRTLDHQEKVDKEDDSENDERADLKPGGELHLKCLSQVRQNGVSLSDLPASPCPKATTLKWQSARPGEASVPCVLTDLALGILPYVAPTLP
ncbi:hypothetical protein GCM10027038_48310 [Arthrobacter bambusae]